MRHKDPTDRRCARCRWALSVAIGNYQAVSTVRYRITAVLAGSGVATPACVVFTARGTNGDPTPRRLSPIGLLQEHFAQLKGRMN